MQKINITQKFSKFSDIWSPKIIGELNDNYVKIAKFKGEFIWHKHEQEDEMFLVISGVLLIKFRDKDVTLNEGEFIIIPKGIEHLPVADQEVHVLLLEPKTVLNTGSITNTKTVENLEWL
jgi:mannose-6-phosphate isomerase-like protein (cupin superfamily)